MKFSIKIEFDGKRVIGFIPKMSGCYVQTKKIQEIAPLMKLAIETYRENYKSRMEPFSPEIESPKINQKIQFYMLSANQLENIFRQFNYNKELTNNFFYLYRKADFPFDRILIPNSPDLSPVIIKKLFGTNNVIVLRSDENHMKISGRA